MSKVNQLILSLYRDGRELPLSQYQDWALEQVKGVVPFDSAWWGSAAMEPARIHWLHLYNCDAAIVDDYQPYLEIDFFRAKLMAQPGVSVNMADLISRHQMVRHPLYKNVGKKYKIEWSLGTLLVDTVSSLAEFLTLWRHDPKQPFTEVQRQIKQELMPHLAAAFLAVQLRHFLRGVDTRNKAWALADDHGFLRQASPAFVQAVRQHWPQWQGNLLPQPLADNALQAQKFINKTLAVDFAKSGNLRFLEVKPKSLLDKLSARELDVVRAYSQGQTYTGIATLLGVAPATVRNHIAHAFAKLGVANKAELASRLAGLQNM
jgi:DNA-binding CsgD family transcriptional regulator